MAISMRKECGIPPTPEGCGYPAAKIMNDLEILGLVKRYGDQLVIDGISFQVKESEFFVLLGPSGGGKTTLLRLISGLEQPDKGRIVLKKHDITDLSPRSRNVGMVFQNYGLYPHMDVYGNIAYGLEVRGIKRAEIARRIRKTAAMLDITPLIGKRIQSLSGGEQQRVALARIMARDADIYLYDEPLSSLDPQLRSQARRDILEVHRAKNKPSIYVTHDLHEAYTMGDRIAIIANKRLQQVGTPKQLMQDPANLFVARFAGMPAMNLLPARIQRADGHYSIQHGTLQLPLALKWKHYLRHYGYKDVIAGIRPGALVPQCIFEQMETKPLATFEAKVVEISPLFAEIVMTVLTDDQLRLTSVFQETGMALPKRGEMITLGVCEDLCLFDPHTEQALKPWFD